MPNHLNGVYIHGAYIPKKFPVPPDIITLEELLFMCHYIDKKSCPLDHTVVQARLDTYLAFEPFVEQSMMRELVYEIKRWEYKILDYSCEKCGISPDHKDWASLHKAHGQAIQSYRDAYETYITMLKLHNIDYSYFKFARKY